nr:hypothetical protein CFP56_41463 [Quercus suber]
MKASRRMLVQGHLDRQEFSAQSTAGKPEDQALAASIRLQQRCTVVERQVIPCSSTVREGEEPGPVFGRVSEIGPYRRTVASWDIYISSTRPFDCAESLFSIASPGRCEEERGEYSVHNTVAVVHTVVGAEPSCFCQSDPHESSVRRLKWRTLPAARLRILGDGLASSQLPRPHLSRSGCCTTLTYLRTHPCLSMVTTTSSLLVSRVRPLSTFAIPLFAADNPPSAPRSPNLPHDTRKTTTRRKTFEEHAGPSRQRN